MRVSDLAQACGFVRARLRAYADDSTVRDWVARPAGDEARTSIKPLPLGSHGAARAELVVTLSPEDESSSELEILLDQVARMVGRVLHRLQSPLGPTDEPSLTRAPRPSSRPHQLVAPRGVAPHPSEANHP
jgi:hypothetical protein